MPGRLLQPGVQIPYAAQTFALQIREPAAKGGKRGTQTPGAQLGPSLCPAS